MDTKAEDLRKALADCVGWAGVGLISNPAGMEVKLRQIQDRARNALDGTDEIIAALSRPKS